MTQEHNWDDFNLSINGKIIEGVKSLKYDELKYKLKLFKKSGGVLIFGKSNTPVAFQHPRNNNAHINPTIFEKVTKKEWDEI